MSGMILHGFGRDPADLKQKIKPGTTKRALSFAGPFAKHLGLLIFLLILSALAGITGPILYRNIIDCGILKGDYAVILSLSALVFGLGVIEGVLGMAACYLSARIGAGITLRLRTKLFEHIQKMSLDFFMRAQTGALVNRLDHDVNVAGQTFSDLLSSVVSSLFTAILTVGAMFVLSWRITLLTLFLALSFVCIARLLNRELLAITRKSYELSASMNSLMVERFNVAGAHLVKLFGLSQEESRLFKSEASRVSDLEVRVAIYARLFFSALFLLTLFATTIAYGWGGMLVARHSLDIGAVVALVAYLARLFVPFLGLSNTQVNVMSALVSFERVFELLDLEPRIQEKPEAVVISKGAATISFERVFFGYPPASEVSLRSLEATDMPDETAGRTVLHDITFIAESGQMVALVGPSGAGKTTITQLVARLYDVHSGSIRINSIDVRDAKLDSLRQRIGVVTQDPHLFHDTIRANLLYAKPDASDAEVRNSLQAAQILPLIESLPAGIDTLVGERGYRFSGGEKQRLAIARLLLKAPDIVILDEATAHLDSESEAAIQRALYNALIGRTSIVIAHRLSTILKADRILVVQEGRVIQHGTHAQLLGSPGLYRKLYQQQFANQGT